MTEIKKEVIKEEIIYEITKSELDAIKLAERNKGRKDIFGYLTFVLKNYRYELNLWGCGKFCENLIDFLNSETSVIENVYKYSFHDYIEHIRS